MSSSTSSSERNAGPPRWPWGLVGALLAVLLIEGVLAARSHGPVAGEERFYPADRTPSLAESLIQWQVVHALGFRERQDILLVGDSSCLMGLQPEILMERTGWKTWNLGSLAWLGVGGHHRLAELFIERHGPPKLLVYHFAVSTLYDPSRREKNRRFLQRTLTWIDATVPSPGTAKGEGLRGWSLPSLAYRETLRGWLLSGAERSELLEAPRGPFPPDGEVRRRLLEDRGYLADPRERSWKKAPRIELQITPEVTGALMDFFAAMEGRGVHVLVMLNPLPELAATPENLAVLHSLDEHLRELAAPFARVRIADPLVKLYDRPDRYCSGMKHLTGAGARRNSEELSRYLLEHRGMLGL